MFYEEDVREKAFIVTFANLWIAQLASVQNLYCLILTYIIKYDRVMSEN